MDQVSLAVKYEYILHADGGKSRYTLEIQNNWAKHMQILHFSCKVWVGLTELASVPEVVLYQYQDWQDKIYFQTWIMLFCVFEDTNSKTYHHRFPLQSNLHATPRVTTMSTTSCFVQNCSASSYLKQSCRIAAPFSALCNDLYTSITFQCQSVLWRLWLWVQ